MCDVVSLKIPVVLNASGNLRDQMCEVEPSAHHLQLTYSLIDRVRPSVRGYLVNSFQSQITALGCGIDISSPGTCKECNTYSFGPGQRQLERIRMGS